MSEKDGNDDPESGDMHNTEKIGRVTEFSYVTLGLFIFIIIIKYDHHRSLL